MKRKKKIWFWVVLILILISLAAYFSIKKKKITVIESDKAIKRLIVKTVSASGMIEPVKKVNISSSLSANIDSLLVAEGREVKKGDLLVLLDRKNILAEVEQQKAALSQQKFSSATALLQLKQIKLDFDNKAKLKENGFIPENEFENIKLSLEIAEKHYESSLENIRLQTAYLDQAMDKLGKTSIYAPLDGIVTKLYKEQGEMVLGSQFNTDVILSISDLNAFMAKVNVDENDVAQVSQGDSVRVTVEALGDTVFKGTVLEIGNTPLNVGSPDSPVEYIVTVDLLTKDDRIKPGMTSYTEIVTDVVNDVLSVPIQALARRKKIETEVSSEKNGDTENGIGWKKENSHEDVIFRLKTKGSGKEGGSTVEMVRIKTGISNERFIEVKEGLNEGDRIVSGDYKTISKVLTDGMEVTEKNMVKP
jgi:HlyD family secretion protein